MYTSSLWETIYDVYSCWRPRLKPLILAFGKGVPVPNDGEIPAVTKYSAAWLASMDDYRRTLLVRSELLLSAILGSQCDSALWASANRQPRCSHGQCWLLPLRGVAFRFQCLSLTLWPSLWLRRDTVDVRRSSASGTRQHRPDAASTTG